MTQQSPIRYRWWIIGAVISLCLWVGFCSLTAKAQMPPQQYRGGTETRVAFLNESNVHFLCNTKPKANMIQACVIDGVIIAPNPCSQSGSYAELLCHELGHANGWSAKHDG